MKTSDPHTYTIGFMEGDRIIAEYSVILLNDDGRVGLFRYLNADMPRDTFVAQIAKFRSLESIGFEGRVKGRSFAVVPKTTKSKRVRWDLFVLYHKDLKELVEDAVLNLWMPQASYKLNAVRRFGEGTILPSRWDKKLLTAIFATWLKGKDLIVTKKEMEEIDDNYILEVRYSSDDSTIRMRVREKTNDRAETDTSHNDKAYRGTIHCLIRGDG